MHPYPKHLGGCDYRGPRRYFLTFCTHDRRPLFTTAERVALVESHFLRTSGESGFADIAHCFMPDHLHAAVEGRTETADAREFIKRMKQYTGYYYKQTFGQRLWQRYGYEHVIRDEETTATVVRYVLRIQLEHNWSRRSRNIHSSGQASIRSNNCSTSVVTLTLADLPPEGGSHNPRCTTPMHHPDDTTPVPPP